MDASEYEEYVEQVVNDLKLFSNAQIYRNRIYGGVTQPGKYEVDIALEVTLRDAINLRFIVECKNWKRPVTRPVVQQLSQTAYAVGAHKAAIASPVGYTKEAIAVAKSLGIALWVVADNAFTGTVPWSASKLAGARAADDFWILRAALFNGGLGIRKAAINYDGPGPPFRSTAARLVRLDSFPRSAIDKWMKEGCAKRPVRSLADDRGSTNEHHWAPLDYQSGFSELLSTVLGFLSLSKDFCTDFCDRLTKYLTARNQEFLVEDIEFLFDFIRFGALDGYQITVLKKWSTVTGNRLGSIHCLRATQFALHGMYEKSIKDFEIVLRKEPENVWALNDMAWLQATCADPNFRNGENALELAKKACDLTGHKNADTLDTLSCALAECGKFGAARRSLDSALKITPNESKHKLKDRSICFRQKRPYFEQLAQVTWPLPVFRYDEAHHRDLLYREKQRVSDAL